MKLRIVGDGTFDKTHVINAETGEVLDDVLAIYWSLGPSTEPDGQRSIARLTLSGVATDMEAHVIVEERTIAGTPAMHTLSADACDISGQ